jgi:tetratricopeptide (TPR) repeat protein
MSNDKPSTDQSLVPSERSSLVAKSSTLAKRGLSDLQALPRVTQATLKKICRDLDDDDFDVRALAANRLSTIGKLLSVDDGATLAILFKLADNLHDLFESNYQPSLFWHGQEYYPPNDSFRNLLIQALESLVGAIDDAIDAVIWLLLNGHAETQVKAAVWLGRRSVGKSISSLQMVSFSSSDKLVTIAVGWALCCLGQNWPIPYFVMLIELADHPKKLNIDKICKLYGMNFSPNVLREILYKGTRYFPEEGVLDLLLDHVTIDDDDSYSYGNLGEIYGQMNRLPEAIEAYAAAIKIDPDPSYYYGQGIAFLHLGDSSAALAICDELKELNKDLAEMLSDRISKLT